MDEISASPNLENLSELERLEAGKVMARYTTNAAQSIPNNSVTIVNFEDQVLDNRSAVTVGAAWKFTAPVGGVYGVSAMLMFASTNTWEEGESGELILYKNGAFYSMLDWKDNYGSVGAVFMALGGADLVHLAAAETLDVRIYQNSDGALALYNSGVSNRVAIWKI